MKKRRSISKPAGPVQPLVSPLYALAREEIDKWKPGFRGVALAVLFCFIHRITTGKTFEETFNSKHQPEPDYQI